jgi:murein DD-endopeptidase MepM/ murein hydrolase activator NlpD
MCRSWVRRGAAVVASAVVAASAVVVAVAPASGQTGGPPADPQARKAAATIERTRRQADATARQLSEFLLEQERLTDELERATRERDAAATRMTELRSGAVDLALRRYVRDASSLELAATGAGDATASVRGATYLRIATGQTLDAEGELKAARQDLDARAAVLERRRGELEAAEQALGAASERLDRELVRLQEAERRRRAEAAIAAEVARRRAEEARRAAAAEAARQVALVRAAPRPGAAAPAPAAPAATVATSAAPAPAAGPPAAAPDASPPPTPASRAGIVCPVEGASAFGDTFGAPRRGRWGHEGVDMMGRSGQPILAAESGTIRHTRSRTGGNQVWLYGDSGTRYFYAHLSSYVGGPRRVAAGEVIGRMGNTGTRVVHLHFEIRPGGGRAINPYPAVRAAC